MPDKTDKKAVVVTQAQAEAMTNGYLVCAPFPKMHEDDIVTLCTSCARRVIHRPHAPKNLKPICLDCVLLEVKAQGEKRPFDFKMTEKTAEEMRSFLMRVIRSQR